MRRVAIALALIWLGTSAPPSGLAAAPKNAIDLSGRAKGQSSGLPTPRFVSLKADEVNVRRGPGWDHAVSWVFRRAGLPVEVIAEFDVWREVRDSEGATGWVLGTLLSGRRTVLVAPWKTKTQMIELYDSPDQSGRVNARLTPGVLADVEKCDGNWCRILAGGVDGYVAQDVVWGAYPGEAIN